MKKYEYSLQNNKQKTICITDDDRNIKDFLKVINGNYYCKKLAWVLQKSTKTNKTKKYMIIQLSGDIKQYCLINFKTLGNEG